MFNLQLLNSQQHLLYLVCFGFSFMILNIDSRISLPWCLLHMVTSVFMSCYTKIMIADLAEISKSNIRGIVFHLHKNIFDSGHVLYSINIDIYVNPFLKWFTTTQCLHQQDE
jgi:hypothetical protein